MRAGIARIADGVRIYAIGDIHGRADLLARLLTIIDADIAARAPRRILLILIGDYVDRGPSSRGVVDLILRRQASFELIALKGNHDTYPLRLMKRPSVFAEWRSLGGIETLMSYGLEPKFSMNETELNKFVNTLKDTIPVSHIEFFSRLVPSFSFGDFFFAHAGVRPQVTLDRQREDDLLWIRDEFLDYEGHFDKMIVHGHTPVDEIDYRTNRINIDTGAYATGRLSALVIEGSSLRTLYTD
jgi:diadenosine tetraphosphatase ApaH/serine/threonine PP2A family protein phosphatase